MADGADDVAALARLVGEEGGFDLGRYPAIRAWLKRVTETPNFVPMG